MSTLECDAEPVATLGRLDIASVLNGFLAGQLDAGAVEEWANLVECREDITFERREEETVADAIFDLANPALQGPLGEIAPRVMARLGG